MAAKPGGNDKAAEAQVMHRSENISTVDHGPSVITERKPANNACKSSVPRVRVDIWLTR